MIWQWHTSLTHSRKVVGTFPYSCAEPRDQAFNPEHGRWNFAPLIETGADRQLVACFKALRIIYIWRILIIRDQKYGMTGVQTLSASSEHETRLRTDRCHDLWIRIISQPRNKRCFKLVKSSLLLLYYYDYCQTVCGFFLR